MIFHENHGFRVIRRWNIGHSTLFSVLRHHCLDFDRFGMHTEPQNDQIPNYSTFRTTVQIRVRRKKPTGSFGTLSALLCLILTRISVWLVPWGVWEGTEDGDCISNMKFGSKGHLKWTKNKIHFWTHRYRVQRYLLPGKWCDVFFVDTFDQTGPIHV